MRIGIDLAPLQNAHRMRGIGYTLINFLNNISEKDRQNEFVFFVLPENEALFKDPLELLDLHDMSYEVRQLKEQKRLPYILPGRLNMILGIINRFRSFRSFYFGDSRIPSLKDIDVFLQADQNFALPRGHQAKKVLIIYDLIPFILEWDYWRGYKSARLAGISRSKSVLSHVKRYLLMRKVRVNTRKADKLLAISELTKRDFMHHISVASKKIDVTLLGVSSTNKDGGKQSDADVVEQLEHYVPTSWGYVKRALKLELSIPFLLYVGGADSRRKLEDLVTAFNHLRSQGYQIKLVLVGDIMLGPDAITNETIAKSLNDSSYLEDIIFMGFANDATKQWLYQNALAFVFPSRYEGFGLPVLEAMVHDCPVISYKNAAVYEVVQDTPIYTDGPAGIMESVLALQATPKKDLEAKQRIAIKQASKYSWDKTSSEIMRSLQKVAHGGS